jgi:hypothetical protein
LVLHVGDFVFSIAAGAVFLFMLDRFLRFWQSRATVDIVSAACRPCGTVELVFSKPASKISSTSCSSVFCVLLLVCHRAQSSVGLCRSPVQCSQLHLCSSARAVVLAVAPVQCVLQPHGWEVPHVDPHKSSWHMDRQAEEHHH